MSLNLTLSSLQSASAAATNLSLSLRPPPPPLGNLLRVSVMQCTSSVWKRKFPLCLMTWPCSSKSFSQHAHSIPYASFVTYFKSNTASRIWDCVFQTEEVSLTEVTPNLWYPLACDLIWLFLPYSFPLGPSIRQVGPRRLLPLQRLLAEAPWEDRLLLLPPTLSVGVAWPVAQGLSFVSLLLFFVSCFFDQSDFGYSAWWSDTNIACRWSVNMTS